jgi:hypothetical protein
LTTKIKKLTTKIKVKASVSETVQAFGNKATIEQVLSEMI